MGFEKPRFPRRLARMVWNAIKALFTGAEEAGAVFKEERVGDD